MIDAMKDNARALLQAAAAARTAGLVVAVRAGRGQIQRVTYDARGVATITPLSGWSTGHDLLARIPPPVR